MNALAVVLTALVCACSATSNLTSAYYLVFAAQVSDPSFPQQHVAGHDVYIVQPANFTPALVSKLRGVAKPGAKVLLYFDSLDLPLYVPGNCSTGHVMGDRKTPPRSCNTPQQPFYQCGPSAWQTDIQAAFPASWAAQQVCSSGSSVICLYPGLSAFVWSMRSSDAAARLLHRYVKLLGADGVYLDDLETSYTRVSAWTAPMYAAYNKSGCGVDVSGDGVADTLAEAIAQGASWQPYFLAQLRSVLGPHAIVLANSGGSFSSPLVSGITIEMEACAKSQRVCEEAFVASQRTVALAGGGAPTLSIAWLKDPQTFPRGPQCEFARRLQSKYPWIAVGVDIFDGAVVIC